MTWLRDLLVIPLIVGLVLAIFTFLLPRSLGEGKELSYEIEGPTNYLNDPAIGHMELSVNGTKTAKLVAYRIQLLK